MPSVKEMGLDNYLNATKDLHGGWGYEEFKLATDDNVIQAEIARKMKVDRGTIIKWQKIYEEQNNGSKS